MTRFRVPRLVAERTDSLEFFLRVGWIADGLGLLRDGLLVCVLLALAWADVRRGVLPNVCVLPAGAAGLVLSAASDPERWWVYPASAAGVGAGLLVIAVFYQRGLGMGDVKMGAMMGAFLGPYAFLAVFFGAVLGMLVAGALIGLRRIGTRTPVPFGAFMAAGGAATLICGPEAYGWYVELAFG